MASKYTKEILEPIISRHNTWADVCRELGIVPATGSQTHLRNTAMKLGLSFDHFVGKASNKGKTFHPKQDVSYYLVEKSSVKSDFLRRRLIKDGLKEEKCERCGITEWLGAKPPLELHHVNGIHDDCRLENLQVLCPNCHAQIGPSRRKKFI